MFALEISFQDQESTPEMILVRRPQFLLGSSDDCHVVIDDMSELGFEILVSKDIGSNFRCKPVENNIDSDLASLIDGIYDTTYSLDLGPVVVKVFNLDYDLNLRESEAPDKASMRVLRQSISLPAPSFPALLKRGDNPVVVSFVANQSIYIGRSNECAMRVDASDISNKHARIGFESGRFWIEDLGSTNGTFIEDQQISGRADVAPATAITLGVEHSFVGINSYDQLKEAHSVSYESTPRTSVRKYPVLLSCSDVARPARLIIPLGEPVSIGRDPGSEIWLGAPHVSRKHCEIILNKNSQVVIKDCSTNGTGYHGGIIQNKESIYLEDTPTVLDFGGDVTVALCFNGEEETQFLSSQGAITAFGSLGLEDTAHGLTLGVRNTSKEENTFFTIGDTISSTGIVKQYVNFYASLSLPVKLVCIFAFLGFIALLLVLLGVLKALII